MLVPLAQPGRRVRLACRGQHLLLLDLLVRLDLLVLKVQRDQLERKASKEIRESRALRVRPGLKGRLARLDPLGQRVLIRRLLAQLDQQVQLDRLAQHQLSQDQQGQLEPLEPLDLRVLPGLRDL